MKLGNMISKSPQQILALLSLNLFAATTLPTSAALIAYDNFTGYTAGQMVGQSQGSGWSNAWSGSTEFQVTTTGGLTHASSTGTGGAANSGTSLADAFITASRSFTTSLPATGDVYFGFLMQQTGTPQGAGISLSGGTSTELWAGTWNNATQWQLARNIPTNQYGNITTGVNESTSTVFFVLKLELTSGNDTARLFVNPANAAALTGAGNASYTYTNFATPTGLSLFRQNSTGDGNVSIDELRVGTAAADMFATIPEPSTALLCSLGLFALLHRRRN